MRHSILIALASASLALPLAAYADTTSDFNINGLLDQGTISGTLSIDTTNGTVVGENFAADGYTFTDANLIQGPDKVDQVPYAVLLNPDDIAFEFFFADSSLVNYTGGLLCTSNDPCTGDMGSFFGIGNGHDFLNTGSLQPVAPSPTSITPEPISLLLFGTGLLGTLGVMRKRSAVVEADAATSKLM